MKAVTKKAKEFRKQFGIKGKPTYEQLVPIFDKLGYKLSPYSSSTKLLKAIEKIEYSKTVSAFTYQRNADKYVFYDDNISKTDLVFLFSHEAGHIYLGHLNTSEGTTEHREEEAYTFAVELCKKQSKLLRIIITIFLVASLCFNAVTLSELLLVEESKTENSFVATDETVFATVEDNNTYVYITKSGEKYHKGHCPSIINRKTLKVTLDEALELDFEPCMHCEPDREQS